MWGCCPRPFHVHPKNYGRVFTKQHQTKTKMWVITTGHRPPHVYTLSTRHHYKWTTPPHYLHTKEWRHGNEALSWLCLLPPILATYYHLVPFCLLMQNVYKYTEVSSAQLDTGSWPPKRTKKSVDKDKKIGELDLVRSRFSLEEYVGGISAYTAI